MAGARKAASMSDIAQSAEMLCSNRAAFGIGEPRHCGSPRWRLLHPHCCHASCEHLQARAHT
eukprot:10757178-Heterocapsa_arctica.AAC.1